LPPPVAILALPLHSMDTGQRGTLHIRMKSCNSFKALTPTNYFFSLFVGLDRCFRPRLSVLRTNRINHLSRERIRENE
jgi:hypothetical protein